MEEKIMKNNISIPAPGVGAISAEDPETEAFKLAALHARVGNSPFLELLNKRTPEQVRADLEEHTPNTK
jgi:hypothetical protein